MAISYFFPDIAIFHKITLTLSILSGITHFKDQLSTRGDIFKINI